MLQLNLFQADVPIKEKPGGWFFLAKYEKHLWKSKILSKDLHLYLRCHSSTDVFQTFC